MPPEDPQQERPQQDTPPPGGRLASLLSAVRRMPTWAAAHRIKAAVLGGTCLVVVGGAVVAWWFVAAGWGSRQEDVTVAAALEALDAGALVEARDLAARLSEQPQLPADEEGAPSFILGAAACREAEDAWGKEKKTNYLLAARHLEEARDRGFPEGRRAEGLYLLGESLYMSGRIPASRLVLRAALEADPPRRIRTEIHRLLADACLHDTVPKLKEALAHNGKYLAGRLGAKQRYWGLLQRGQILLRLEKIPECLAILREIPPKARNRSEAVVLTGQVLMHEAQRLQAAPQATVEDRRKARQKYEAAVKTLREAQDVSAPDNKYSCQAMYLIGVCLLHVGKPTAATEQFKRTRMLYLDSPEAFAAGFQEAELARHYGNDERALAIYGRLLAEVEDPKNFSNPWVTLKQLRGSVLEAYERYLETRNYKSALQLTRMLHPTFSAARTMELAAGAYRSWGQGMLDQAEHLPPQKALLMREQGRERLRRAGQIYAKLARIRVATRHYPDDLWNCAESIMQGHGYAQAVRILQEYLNNESRRRHPQALVTLGEALLALGKPDAALTALQECVEFHPKDAAAYRARWLAGRVYREKGDQQQAEKLLREIRNGEGVTPSSRVWQDAFFDLAELLHAAGRFDEAIQILEEAVQRYPDSRRAMRSRYLIGDCYRRNAKAAQEELRKDLVEVAYFAQSKQIQEMLHAALKRYEEVRELLRHRRDTTELDALEKKMLRNSHFSIGDVLFELRQYQAAIKAYATVTNRCQNQPEVLQAYLQIARAHQRLGQFPQAKTTIQQGKIVLSRIKADDNRFLQTTNYTRKQWNDLLGSQASL